MRHKTSQIINSIKPINVHCSKLLNPNCLYNNTLTSITVRYQSSVTASNNNNTTTSTTNKQHQSSYKWQVLKFSLPLIILFAYDRYQIEDDCKTKASQLQSATNDEIRQLILRTRLTSKDILSIYQESYKLYPTGLCTIDEYCSLVTKYINNNLNVWKQQLQQYNDINGNTDNHNDIIKQLEQLDINELERSINSHNERKFNEWELNCLYRLSPTAKQKRYNTDDTTQLYLSLNELLLGLTVLCEDKLTPKQAYELYLKQIQHINSSTDIATATTTVQSATQNNQQRSDNQQINTTDDDNDSTQQPTTTEPIRYIHYLQKQSINKLSLSYLLYDIRKQGVLNQQQLAKLLDTLIRLGHIDTDTLVHTVPLSKRVKPYDIQSLMQYVRPQRTILQGQQLAEYYIHMLSYIDTLNAVEDMSVRDVLTNYLSSKLSQELHPRFVPFGITKSQFATLIQHINNRSNIGQYWYLKPSIQPNNKDAGIWYRFKRRVSYSIKYTLAIRTVDKASKQQNNNNVQQA